MAALGEFALIRRWFAGLAPGDDSVALGIGDDAALLRVPAGEELAVTTDTLISGRHFPERTAAADVGWKALAVNLSDLAAMGARPRWFTLALTLPEADAAWLEGFATGLGELARAHGVALVGGDTTRGPLAITITAMGHAPAGSALRRSGAQPGDVVCVTGTLGDAALALQLWSEREGLDAPPRHSSPDRVALLARLLRPAPRVHAGLALREAAHAAIDLSDGLAADLGHVLAASGVGARIDASRLPSSAAFAALAPEAQRLELQAAGGDDYELCVCLPPAQLEPAQRALDVPLTAIGEIVAGSGLRIVDADGQALHLPRAGYTHF